MDPNAIGDRTGAHRVGWVRFGFLVLAVGAALHTLTFTISFAEENAARWGSYGYGAESAPRSPDTGSAYLAFFIIAAILGAAAAFTALAAAKPPESQPGVYTYYATTLSFPVRVLLEVVLDVVMIGMIWLGTAGLFDSILRPTGGVGYFIGPVCVFFGLWLLLFRPFTVIDTHKKIIRRTSFPFRSTLEFEQIAKIDVIEVIGNRGPAGWAVVALPKGGGGGIHLVKTGYLLEGALDEMRRISEVTGIPPGQ